MPKKTGVLTSYTGGVYEIRNITNGKVYIGQTARFAHRWSVHRASLRGNKHHSSHLQRAWNFYGEDAFAFRILEVVDPYTIEKACEVEQRYMDSVKPEYNVSMLSGGSRIGLNSTTEHIDNMKAAFSRPEVQAKLAQRPQSLVKSDDHRAAIGEKLKGNKNGAGHKISPETRAKMNAARAAKIAAGWKPGPHVITEEMREKGRQAAAKRIYLP